MRVYVTGGSGFIGTNVVQAMLDDGHEVRSTDLAAPVCRAHEAVFERVDLLDAEALAASVTAFRPQWVVHLGARTDLDGKTVGDYAANTDGVRNLIAAIAAAGTVERTVYVSTKLVCRNDHAPASFEEYCPDTVYGESKVLGERIVHEADPPGVWCLTRPTGIWGPWFHVPYRGFFEMVLAGRYVHPGGTDAPKSFGYVGNVVHQIRTLLTAPADGVHRRTFYLADYTPTVIRDWADAISLQARGRRVRRVPGVVMAAAARIGDVLKCLGWRNPPMTSFRLRNMKADTSRIPLENMKSLTGEPLPYTMEQGVAETLAWLKPGKGPGGLRA